MSNDQRNLFSTDPDPWELDDAAVALVASVVLTEGVEGQFDYLVPEAMREALKPGCRVRAPFGKANRNVVGYCVAVAARPVARRLKALHSVVDEQALLSSKLLDLTRWMADYYLCPWGQALEAAVPAGVREGAGTREVELLEVPSEAAIRWTQLKLPPKQAAAFQALLGAEGPLTASELATVAGCSTAPIKRLLQQGLLVSKLKRMHHASTPTAASSVFLPEEASAPQLTGDQRQALDVVLGAVRRRDAAPIVLHGVTGSGKTEVYLQAIAEVLSYGQQAIVLVPEISLTPQTERRFRARLGNIAVLHSHLSPIERHAHWRRIAAGQSPVVVGARSAVFAPTPNLGLIILDEEHDNSFKQDLAPRYHARTVARQRAAREGAALVLGSATPSLETYQAVLDGQAVLVRMPKRVENRKLPYVEAIDLRSQALSKGRGALSRPLALAIRDALRDDGQVILLLNRRGFSTLIQCPACGEVVKCPHCELALTHHRQDEKAICHYCEFQTLAPHRCPACAFEGLQYSGLGTQRLEAEVRARFPQATCARMDSDSMRKHGSHEQVLNEFREGRAQILLGTQMIAKGLDFPNVTLVGVVNADSALSFADFRAAERTFQLVTQVAGRTGRGSRGGHVMVQTYQPEHPAIMAALRHDYEAFAAYELPQRQAFGYPPFGSMLRMVTRSESAAAAEQFALAAAELADQALSRLDAQARRLGPAPAPLAKLRGKYRRHALWVSPRPEALREGLREASRRFKAPENVQWILDVDPVDML